jgi:hypothetical protein
MLDVLDRIQIARETASLAATILEQAGVQRVEVALSTRYSLAFFFSSFLTVPAAHRGGGGP